MGKDIYEVLVDRLNKAGFVFSTDCEIEKNDSMLIAARYAMSDKNQPSYIASSWHMTSVAEKLELSVDELEVLLAILNEDKEDVTVSDISVKHNRNELSIRSMFYNLKRKGYLSTVEGSPFRESGFRLTNRGLMCLLAGQPMDKLDTEPFIKLEPEDLLSTTSGRAVSRKSRTIPGAEDMFDSMFDVGTEYSVRVLPDEKVDVPFLDFLKTKVADFSSGKLSVNHLVGFAEMCLKNGENKRFRDAFHSIGFEKLPDNQKAFLLLLCDYFTKNGTVPMNFTRDSSPIDVSQERFEELSSAAKSLVTTGLVVIPPDDTYSNNKDEIVKERYMLSPDAVGAVFHGMTQFINYASLCRQADVWKSDSIEPKNLLFDGEMSQKVAALYKLIDPSSSATLLKRLAEVGRKSLTCLFYGAPGVGKTELCRQLARSTGRDCIVADPAKLNGCYWGDSEKNAREVFRAYKYLYKISDKAPILVFNEADGIISKRFTEVNRATEKSENAVQAIILQELESFEGIFIATTNLQNNLDVAADRRFLYKMRFDYPSAQIRKAIICMKMKWISEEDAQTLSREFCLSGGQVDNLASKCVIEKFMTGQEASLEKMRSFCREEVSMRSAETRQDSRIGFIRYPQKASK